MNSDDTGLVGRVVDNLQSEQFRLRLVHPTDIEDLLASIDMLESVEQDEVSCSECDRAIDIDSIGRIYGEQQEVKIACDNVDCFFGDSGTSATDDGGGDNGSGYGHTTPELIATEAEIQEALAGEDRTDVPPAVQ